jgi:hypothetical protein
MTALNDGAVQSVLETAMAIVKRSGSGSMDLYGRS